MIKAFVFDMDGVIYDTERICRIAWKEAAQIHQLDRIEEDLDACTGLNRHDTELYFKNKYGADFDFASFNQRTRQYSKDYLAQHGVPLKPGVVELLEELKKRNCPIALATSTHKESAMAHLTETNLTKYFDAIITGDMVTHSKPDPEIYLIACKALATNPHNCAAIEDSPNGIRSAYNANMNAIMVPDLIAPTEEISKLLSYRFDSLLELKDSLSTLLSE